MAANGGLKRLRESATENRWSRCHGSGVPVKRCRQIPTGPEMGSFGKPHPEQDRNREAWPAPLGVSLELVGND